MTRPALIAALLALILAVISAVPALAAQATITPQACAQGLIRDRSGAPISRARCDSLIGQPVQLAQTGLDAWLLALAGVVCVGSSLALRRSLRRAPSAS